jgi:hypothetical protein
LEHHFHQKTKNDEECCRERGGKKNGKQKKIIITDFLVSCMAVGGLQQPLIVAVEWGVMAQTMLV